MYRAININQTIICSLVPLGSTRRHRRVSGLRLQRPRAFLTWQVRVDAVSARERAARAPADHPGEVVPPVRLLDRQGAAAVTLKGGETMTGLMRVPLTAQMEKRK